MFGKCVSIALRANVGGLQCSMHTWRVAQVMWTPNCDHPTTEMFRFGAPSASRWVEHAYG